MTALARLRLPDTRESITRKFRLLKSRAFACPKCGHTWTEQDEIKIWSIAGLYEDGRCGELFIHGGRLGSMAHGALVALAVAVSIGLQHGIEMSQYVRKFRHMRFGAHGFTGDKQFPSCTSVVDLIAQWLESHFCPKGEA